jgi:hypothetical protein
VCPTNMEYCARNLSTFDAHPKSMYRGFLFKIVPSHFVLSKKRSFTGTGLNPTIQNIVKRLLTHKQGNDGAQGIRECHGYVVSSPERWTLHSNDMLTHMDQLRFLMTKGPFISRFSIFLSDFLMTSLHTSSVTEPPQE